MKGSLLGVCLFFMCITGLTAQNASKMNYEEQWKKIDKLRSEEKLPKSALTEIEKVYNAGLTDKKYDHVVKAIIYRMNCQAVLEEDAINTIFASLQKELTVVPQPAKSLVYFMLAQLHYDYFRQNQWLVLQRTNTDIQLEDIKTWDAVKLVNEAVKYYNLSLEQSDELQRVPISDYATLLTQYQGNYEKFLPTLYDFLAYKAFTFFSNPNTGLTRPQQTFLLNKPGYFADAATFINTTIEQTDTTSLEYQCLSLLQKVIAVKLVNYTQREDGLASLINWDMWRLDYMQKNGRYADNGALYEAGLKQQLNTYKDKPQHVYASYALAYWYNNQGKTWRQTKKPELRNKRVEALSICRDIVEKYPKSDILGTAKELIREIEAQSFDLQLPNTELPGAPVLAYVNYRNLNNLKLLVYKVEESLLTNRDNLNNQQLTEKVVQQGKLVSEISRKLPSQPDYQNYSTEIKLDGLQPGYYAVVATNKENVKLSDTDSDNLVSLSTLQISNLFLYTTARFNGQMLYVTNRKTGQPVTGAKIEVYSRDYRGNKTVYKLSETVYTNEKGEASINKTDRLYSPRMIVTKGNERLVTDKNYFNRYYEDKSKSTEIVLFTDRSIYRPGQTVYYKGIAFKRDGTKPEKELVKGLSGTITLRDVNWQETSKENFRTNDYGTISGSFTIPQGLLNGTMTINTNWGSIPIQVEEYKRPTFEVKFDPVKDNYKLNSQVEVSGNAKALAGYNIDDAKVQYRVVRSARYTFFRWWYPPIYMGGEREITSGILKTDSKGEFKVNFTAEADDVKNNELIYVYRVIADVTDVNGETRSATLSVNIGNKPLLIDVNIPEELKPTVTDIPFKTTNLNGDFTSAKVSVTVNQLQSPEKLYRKRFWNEPDTLSIPQAEFEKDFPLDAYGPAVTPDKYEVGKQVWQTSFDTDEVKKLDLSALKKNGSGWYSIKIKATDKNGVELENTYYTNVLADKPEKITNIGNWLTVVKDNAEPGENAEFWVAGGESKSYVRYQVLLKGKVLEQKLIETGTTPQRIVIPVTEQSRGGFDIQFAMVQNNRLYSSNNRVNVPFTNKELDITFSTFRDVLLPGEQEKWTLRIKNKKGEKEMAEMVATLYDASLDALRPHSWSDINRFYSQNYTYSQGFEASNSTGATSGRTIYYRSAYSLPFNFNKPDFNFFGYEYRRALNERNQYYGFLDSGVELEESVVMGSGSLQGRTAGIKIRGVSTLSKQSAPAVANVEMVADADLKQESFAMADQSAATGGTKNGVAGQPQMELSEVTTRQNFNETAFFYPELRTNEDGEIVIEFVIPEALTRWKMMGFAHTQDLKIGTVENNLVTQKQVAISANAPRFFRENDTLVFTAKVNNITEGKLSGQAMLQVYDALTMQPVNTEIIRTAQTLSFDVNAGESAGLAWTLKIPAGIQAIGYKVTAQAGTHTDGEEKVVPVLTNSMLVTETMPFYIRGGQDKTFTFERLRDVNSTTLRNHSLTLEYTSAPAWYAIQSLPYLMEYPYECAEQVFSRYYANSLASTIANSSPKVKQVFDLWKNLPDSKALLSNLEKNQELKQAMLEETPWVMQAKNETERKKRVGLLFDLNKMGNELNRAMNKLEKMQYANGGFPWFDGLPASRYITQHITAGLEHMKKLNAISEKHVSRTNTMLSKSISKLDSYILEDYNSIRDKEQQNIGSMQLHYLYACSFSRHKPANAKQLAAFDYYFGQAAENWAKFGLYEKAMLSLVMDRYGRRDVATKILASLKEYAQQSDEMGMYWKENRAGYFWYQAPIETQAILIEAFNEVANDKQAVAEMKIWLLRNKQTNDWKTTKATTEACYALLMTGESFLSNSQPLDVKVNNKPLAETAKEAIQPEPGTGYVKTVWTGSDVSKDMATIQVTNPNPSSMAWGAMYWQYFEQLDKITHAETNLKMNKQLFLKTITDRGEVLKPLSGGAKLQVGDVVKVRMELRADRDYEYVHLKDMRAAGFEPVSTVSGHRYQDGLWYYESIKDASTNFFITYLRKGTYVFEYELRVSHAGEFSNGISTFQCMYAPEFNAHSEGIRIRVE